MRSMVDASLDELARLEDPAFYLGNPFPVYRRLRCEAPVFIYKPLNTRVVTRYDDVRFVTRNADVFSSAQGEHLTDARNPAQSDDSNIGALLGDDGELLSVTDPPRHGELRRIAIAPFAPGGINTLRPRVERICDKLLDRIQYGEPVDWAKTVAMELPILTACAMLGLPGDNIDEIRSWSDAVEVASNPQSPEELQEAFAKFASLDTFVREQVGRKRQCPADDMLSHLIAQEQARDNITQANIVTMAQALIAGGNDTTAATIAGFVALLAEFPDQRERLLACPELIPSAIEEVMRLVTPARGFLRTVTRDSELRDAQLHRGDRIYFLLEAANRDEQIFPDPDTFDVGRKSERPPIAFGHGPHTCIAAPLARMEVNVLAQRLLERFPSWEFAGTPKNIWSIFRSGWEELPVRFTA
jgi:cytochrome P450